MSLRSVDLNLLPILRALLKEASITKAAAQLGLSQPAVSNALGRLRGVIGDPLLVQVGRAMRLTPRASGLLPELDAICGLIESMLQKADFSPAATKRTFVVATPDYVALLLGPALIETFNAAAPGVSVRFTDVPQDFRNQLASGAIDLAIIAWIDELTQGFCFMRGFMDHMVGVCAQDHPFARTPPKTRAAMAAYPHISVDPGFHHPADLSGVTKVMTAGRGPLRLGASRMLMLPLLAARTRCIAVAPKALADYVFGLAPIAIFPLPGETESIDVCMMWSPLHDADQAHIWFREILDGLLRRHFKAASAL